MWIQCNILLMSRLEFDLANTSMCQIYVEGNETDQRYSKIQFQNVQFFLKVVQLECHLNIHNSPLKGLFFLQITYLNYGIIWTNDNQCDHASGNLRRHLKTYSGENSNKCRIFMFTGRQFEVLFFAFL